MTRLDTTFAELILWQSSFGTPSERPPLAKPAAEKRLFTIVTNAIVANGKSLDGLNSSNIRLLD